MLVEEEVVDEEVAEEEIVEEAVGVVDGSRLTLEFWESSNFLVRAGSSGSGRSDSGATFPAASFPAADFAFSDLRPDVDSRLSCA